VVNSDLFFHTKVTRQVSQRDILSALDFNIGSITPQSFMDELWLALPTLRKATEPLKDGWESAKHEIWDRLFDALLGTLSHLGELINICML
jgi:hypothetical protein